MAIPPPLDSSFNWIKYSKYEYIHCQCIPTYLLNWCQCISSRMSMHLTKKYFFAWSIDQISVSPIINHHGHYRSYCLRHDGVNLISQGGLCEILDELHLRPLASSNLGMHWHMSMHPRFIPVTKGQFRGKCFHLMTSSRTYRNYPRLGQQLYPLFCVK